MLSLSRRAAVTLLALAISLPLGSNAALANGGNNPVELSKYFNPFQKKGYLNESQDRVIKKKAFKVGDLPVAEPAVNKELGFFVEVPLDKQSDQNYINELLTNKRVNGIYAVIPWSALQPTEENFNWQPVDQLLTSCQQNHKSLMLKVATCGSDQSAESDTPKWVYEQEVQSIKYKTADGKEHVAPLFWDKNYLAKWSNFVSELADRYDKNPNIHSIGITGGGFAGGTSIVPEADAEVVGKNGKTMSFIDYLKKEQGLNSRQLVEHWKYVADLFPKRFANARLNFTINAPAKGRWGEDALDEIADYLVYRYGQRIYLTRAGLKDDKHGFDDYRLLLKFRHDTLTGVQLTSALTPEHMSNVSKHALDDGVSFAVLPISILNNSDEKLQFALDQLNGHIGYQLLSQGTKMPDKLATGESLKASFAFLNLGAAGALRPERNLDKDSPMSYRLQVELRNANDKAVLQNIHTPEVSTSQWEPGKSVTWDEELKMVDANRHQLPPGEYTVWISMVDPAGSRKLTILHATPDGKTTSSDAVEVGKLLITASVADTKMEASNDGGKEKHQ